MLKTVLIGRNRMTALIDTGCDRNLIRRDSFDKLNIGLNRSYRVELSGIANTITTTIGATEIDMLVDGCQVATLLHVVPNYVIPMDIMLGKEFFKKVIMIISHGEVKIFKECVRKKNFSWDILKRLEKLCPCNDQNLQHGLQNKSCCGGGVCQCDKNCKTATATTNIKLNEEFKTNYIELISMCCDLFVEYQILLEEFEMLEREFGRFQNSLKCGNLNRHSAENK